MYRPSRKKTQRALIIATIAIVSCSALYFPQQVPPIAATMPGKTYAPDVESTSTATQVGLMQTEATTTDQAPTPPNLPPTTPHAEAISQVILAIEQTMNAVDDPNRETLLTQLLPTLIKLDPIAAGYLAENWEPGSLRQELLRRVSQTWAEVDLASALTWAAKLKDDGERKAVASEVCPLIALTNPEEAIKMAELFDLSGYKGTMEELVQLWANKDMRAALDWIRIRAADEPRDRLLERIVGIPVETEPFHNASLIVQ